MGTFTKFGRTEVSVLAEIFPGSIPEREERRGKTPIFHFHVTNYKFKFTLNWESIITIEFPQNFTCISNFVNAWLIDGYLAMQNHGVKLLHIPDSQGSDQTKLWNFVDGKQVVVNKTILYEQT